ncbi:probable adenylate kinase at N-terminal half [Coccomyxa sp. Obi]|nr:probable adenylate kinase at N-terminal half [Coccomyxa sp. Obi]
MSIRALAQQALDNSVTGRNDEAHVKLFHDATDKVNFKARVVFDACWRKLEEKYKDRIQCPREIVWLNGAPGAGKGANTPFILESRGLTRAETMSSLLERHAEIRDLMAQGELVPDTMVGDALLDVIFNPDVADGSGLVIDGFPRTALQADFLKMLYDKMTELHMKHADSPEEWRYPLPSFKVVVLYVEQEESVRRQMMRATMVAKHNTRVLDAGAGQLWELRPTDVDSAKCRRRYEVFKAHYSTLLRLKQYFPFSLIDAMGSLEECKAQIARELRYQSSLDLDEATYAAIRHLPLAKDLVRSSRQQLVAHLDGYAKRHQALFEKVVRVIDTEAVPLLKRCSLAGHAELKTRNPIFGEHPLAADMFIDVLTDRGFSVAHVVDEQIVPVRVDLQTGKVVKRVDRVNHFRITFETQGVRDASSLVANASKEALDSVRKIAIGQTLVPTHMARERFGDKSAYAAAAAAAAPGSQPQLDMRSSLDDAVAAAELQEDVTEQGQRLNVSRSNQKWEEHFVEQEAALSADNGGTVGYEKEAVGAKSDPL